MCLTAYGQQMRNCKNKQQHRYQMVNYAIAHGVKPATRIFNTSPPVVRKWKSRFKQYGYQGLADHSRRPHHSPKETPQRLQERIVALKDKYKRLGADQIKIIENLPLSACTMRKIWRKHGVASRKRRKKHVTKNNLREIKKQFQLFQMSCEDTKDLIDIPEYWPAMKQHNLPRVQYTFREVSCGIQFTAFANERSLTHATLFAQYINYWLTAFNAWPEVVIRQTDNGSEYCGSWQSKHSSSYTLAVESIPGGRHQTIFPGAHRMQADVETVHNISEVEFYEIEHFKDRQDFLNKSYSYQLFFNLERPNTYKENKTPWQLAKEKIPNLDKRALMIPSVDLDAMLDIKILSSASGGNYLLLNP
jgi:transposase